MPRFSVIVPVYNRARTVLPTLQSVRDQTFENFECIVVDDGSADGEQLKTVVEGLNDPRFRYVRRENGGASAARNAGINVAKGEVVAFLDSDGWWLADKLQQGTEAGAGGSVLFSAVAVERGGRIVGLRPKVRPRRDEPMAEYLACRGGWTATSTMSLPLTLAQAVPFDEAVKFGGDDTDFAIRLAAEGAEFHMLPRSGVILLDDETGDRLSRSNDWQAALEWLNKIRPLISHRAHLAYRGWHVARMAADSGQYSKAIQFYTAAVARAVFAPDVAARALAQVLRQSLRSWSRQRQH